MKILYGDLYRNTYVHMSFQKGSTHNCIRDRGAKIHNLGVLIYVIQHEKTGLMVHKIHLFII